MENPPIMHTSDWRDQLQPEIRQESFNKIMDTLKTHPAFSDGDGLLELQKIAQSFEERTYAGATSQRDYLREISFKMHLMKKASGWRAQLHPDSRQIFVNEIFDVLRRRYPVSDVELLRELHMIARSIEKKIFTAANSQSDYVRKISLEMLATEPGSQRHHGQR